MIVFPVQLKKINKCFTILYVKGKNKGLPNLKRYRPVWFNGQRWLCHRLSYHLNIKNIPVLPLDRKSGFVLHTCDNKWCVNPKHLYLGDSFDNVRDMYARNPTIKLSLSKSMKGKQNTLGYRHTEAAKIAISAASKSRTGKSAGNRFYKGKRWFGHDLSKADLESLKEGFRQKAKRQIIKGVRGFQCLGRRA